MNVNSKGVFVVFIFLFTGLFVNAQNRKMEFSTTLGYVLSYDELQDSFEDYAKGVHIGLNLYSKKVKRLKTDIQLSINYSGGSNVSSSFLGVNALYGARFYFTDPEESATVFANALIGGVYSLEEGDDYSEHIFGLGYTLGCFAKFNRFIIGTSIESYNSFIFKAGYTF